MISRLPLLGIVLCCLLPTIARAQGVPLKMPGEVIFGPAAEQDSAAWRRAMHEWREKHRAEIQYDGAQYNRPELAWAQRSFIQPQVMVEERYLFDPATGKYTVDRYLDDLEARYGGIDSVLIWPVYPNIGIDNRNQHDMLHDMPGGLPGLRQMVADFHRRNVRVLFPVMPWDVGTRPEGVPLHVAAARDMKTIGADGINGDTMGGIGREFRKAADECGHPLVLEPENQMGDDGMVAWNNMSWGYWHYQPVPVVSKYKWIEPRHIVNVCERWAKDRTDGLQAAFFNGVGYESWENVWGIWNQLTPRDAAALKRISAIERAVAEMLGGQGFLPHSPTLQRAAGVYASEFANHCRPKLWLLVNRSDKDSAGPQLHVPVYPGEQVYDLWHGVELKPAVEKDFGHVELPHRETRLWRDPDRPRQDAGSRRTAAPQDAGVVPTPLASFSTKWQCLPQKIVDIPRTAPAKKAPEGMVLVRGGKYRFQVSGVEIEGGDGPGVDVQYPWEDLPRRRHDKELDVQAFYIDKYPVTNAQFKRFLDAAGYKPQDAHNFLKDWQGGTYPQGWDRKPVTWVSLEDARCVCRLGRQALPHDWEWQYAAQGNDGRLYPWGQAPDPAALPKPETGRTLRPPTDVDAYPKGASPWGVMDLVGNVWQWADEYVDEHTRAAVLRGGSITGPAARCGTFRRIRGWTSTQSTCSSPLRKTARRCSASVASWMPRGRHESSPALPVLCTNALPRARLSGETAGDRLPHDRRRACTSPRSATAILTPRASWPGTISVSASASGMHFLTTMAASRGRWTCCDKFNVTVIDTPFDSSIVDLAPQRQRSAAAVRAALEKYLAEGGSVLLILQAVPLSGRQGPGLRQPDPARPGPGNAARRRVRPAAAIHRAHRLDLPARRVLLDGKHRPRASGDRGREPPLPAAAPQRHDAGRGGLETLAPVAGARPRRGQRAELRGDPRTRGRTTSAWARSPAAPPIVAVRSFGKGRVMAISVPARSVHANYGVPGWNMIVETAGDRAGRPLQRRGQAGAQRPALAGRNLARQPRTGHIPAEKIAPVEFRKSIDWDRRQFPAPTKGVRGVLGIRTALSDGAGTVAEYAAAAKAAGLSFVVFNEALEKMTPEKLDRLKAECRQASTADFYACPGVEFSDDLANRWAIWSERVVFPQSSFQRAYGETNAKRPELMQWDGQVMHNPGQYLGILRLTRPTCSSPTAICATEGPSGQHVVVLSACRPSSTIAASLSKTSSPSGSIALRDVRHRERGVLHAGIRPCANIGSGRRLRHRRARPGLGPRLAQYACRQLRPSGLRRMSRAARSIEQWAAINTQHDFPFEVRGNQRARCRFQVSSAAGIREVQVHNADYGVVRRFLADGATTFAREFELVHDRDHALTLEVTDRQGRKAVSDEVFLFCYKTSLLRCGDNLNFLDGVGLCWHPDRNEMMPLAQGYQGAPVESIRGYDTAAALTNQTALQTWAVDSITTAELKQYPLGRSHGILRKVLDVVLPGNDVKICDMTMGPLVEPYDSLTRDTPARTSVPAVVEENELFSRVHRSYYLQNRNNMFITWDYRRAREGAKDYRGGMVWHEGKIVFKRAATLAGAVPIMLFYFTPSGAKEGPPTRSW